MKNEFLDYEQSLALKGLGFGEICIGIYNREKTFRFNNCYNPLDRNKSGFPKNNNGKIPVPIFQQAFSFFREKYGLNSYIIDSHSYNWYFNINDIIKDDVVSEVLYFKTHKEAEMACLIKLIEIAEKTKKQ